MIKQNTIRLFALFIFSIFFPTSCSSGKIRVDDATKATVTQVSIQYLQLCFLGKLGTLPSFVLLGEYLKTQNITREEYDFKVLRVSKAWPIERNPLIQLTVKSVEVDEDIALVTFKREEPKGVDFPEFEIKLEWVGASWMIVDDSIFGKGELYPSVKHK